MSIQIGAKPESSFHEPIDLLTDCHRRIERFLDRVLEIARTAGGALTARQREELATSIRYFERASPLHTEDEERSLFPRLRADARAKEALQSVQHLEDEHREADVAHAEINRLGNEWLAAGEISGPDAERLLTLCERLRALYADHIKMEETVIFPLARTVLSPDDQTAIGAEMASRRGVDPRGLPARRMDRVPRREAL